MPTQTAVLPALWDPDHRSTQGRGHARVAWAPPAGCARLSGSEQKQEVRGPKQGGEGQRAGCQEATICAHLLCSLLGPKLRL